MLSTSVISREILNVKETPVKATEDWNIITDKT